MLDYPRLREPLLSTILAAACFIIAWRGERLPDWLRLFAAVMGCIFSGAALVTWLDFIVYRLGERIRELSVARFAGPERYALALKGLTQAQTDMVQRQLGVNLIGIPGDGGPVWYMRGETVDIPWVYVADFLEWSKKTDPYLWPRRDGAQVGGGDGWANGVQYATELTRQIVKLGWADEAAGTHAAILKESLAFVAGQYGVEL